MDFKVIKGGSSSVTKKKIEEQINVFVQHMRAIEQSVSMVEKMARSIDWEELHNRAAQNHDSILQTLRYVKKHYKEIINKDQQKKPDIQVAVDNTKEEDK